MASDSESISSLASFPQSFSTFTELVNGFRSSREEFEEWYPQRQNDIQNNYQGYEESEAGGIEVSQEDYDSGNLRNFCCSCLVEKVNLRAGVIHIKDRVSNTDWDETETTFAETINDFNASNEDFYLPEPSDIPDTSIGLEETIRSSEPVDKSSTSSDADLDPEPKPKPEPSSSSAVDPSPKERSAQPLGAPVVPAIANRAPDTPGDEASQHVEPIPKRVLKTLCNAMRSTAQNEMLQSLLIWVLLLAFFVGALCALSKLTEVILGQVPVIGPLLKWGFHWLSKVFLKGIIDWLKSPQPRPSNNFTSPADDILSHARRVDYNLFATHVNDTQRLSQLGVEMLPLASILAFTTTSLLGIADIVRASDIHYKVELSDGYANLQNSTGLLSDKLSSFDSSVECMVEDLEVHLKITLRNINEIVSPTFSSGNIAVSALAAIPTLTSATCLIVPFMTQLEVVPALSCTLSFVIESQIDCLRSARNYDAYWRPIRSLAISMRSEAQSLEWERKSQAISTQFATYFDLLDKHLNVLLLHAKEGLDLSTDVDKQYHLVNQIRLRNENEVNAKLSEIGIKKDEREKQGWLASILRGKGLSEKEILAIVKLQGQVRNLNEIKTAHRDSYVAFLTCAQIVGDMQRGLQSLYNNIRRNAKIGEWDLANLVVIIESIVPLTGELKRLGHHHNELKKNNELYWRTKQARCITERPDDWEECLFENIEHVKVGG